MTAPVAESFTRRNHDSSLFTKTFSTVSVRLGHGGMSALSPFYPQLRTLVGDAGTAASCLTGRAQMQQTTRADAPLFYHFVGDSKERRRHFETECSGSLAVDDQLEFCGLLDREIGGLGAFKDLVHVLRGTTVHLPKIDSVGHQPASLGKIPESVRRRQSEPGRKLRDLPAQAQGQRIIEQNKPRRPSLDGSLETG